MAVVGFNFNKISIERKKGIKAAKVSVNNNVQITEVGTTDLAIGNAKQQGLTLTFEFTSKYTPLIGGITMTGDVLIMIDDQTKADEIIKEWKKSKKLPQALSTEAMTTILTRCNIQALILTRDINLPPPIPMVLPTGQGAPAKK